MIYLHTHTQTDKHTDSDGRKDRQADRQRGAHTQKLKPRKCHGTAMTKKYNMGAGQNSNHVKYIQI